MQLFFVYITAKDREQAEQIGEKLVEERLAGCVNIIDGMRSIYWWNGALQKDSETVIIAKTSQDLLSGLISRVKELHTYSCPCIAAFPVVDGNPDYLQWLEKQVSDHKS